MTDSSYYFPLVSVVTPSYNQGRFIEDTIVSVKSQTYPNIEHIIIDGGSSDETLGILRKYENTYNMRWISEPDRGQSDAINKGWRISKGEIIGWLNSDDTYLPWAVETAVKFLNGNSEVGMVYGQSNIINERNEEIGQCYAVEFRLADAICGRCGVPQQSMFLRKSIIDEIGYLDINLYMSMDYDLIIRTALKFKIKYIPKVLANFRMCVGTKSVSEEYRFDHDHLYILDKIFSMADLPKEIKALESRAYSYIHLRMGLRFFHQRQMRLALKYIIKSIIFNPSYLRKRIVISALIGSILGCRVTKIAVILKSKLRIK